MERAIAAIPRPYAFTCLVLATVSQSPGLLLANWVDTAR